MKFISSFLILTSVILSCNQRDMTMKELEKAKWDSLAPGVYNISTKNEKGIAGTTDSIAFELKGISEPDVNALQLLGVDITGDLNSTFADALGTKAPDSKVGYLRLNLGEVMMNDMVVLAYLRGDDSTNYSKFLEKDSATLTAMPGITQVKYVSKEQALKKYLADGNQEWEHVLTENPLPSSIELKLQSKKWTKGEMESMKNLIQDKIYTVSDVSYPAIMFKYPNRYYFLWYKRLKK